MAGESLNMHLRHRSPKVSVVQSLLRSLAWNSVILIVRDESERVVGQQLLFVMNEFERRLSPPYNHILRCVPSRLGVGTEVVWNYGPIIHERSQSSNMLKLILEEVDNMAD